MEAKYCLLPGRGVLRLSGADVLTFLQVLITRDLDSLSPEQAVYGALLTPQGKYLFDFFLTRQGDELLLDGEAARLEPLAKRLNMYRLRADVQITDISADWEVCAAFGSGIATALDLTGGAGAAMAYGEGVAFMDPRLDGAGARKPPNTIISALAWPCPIAAGIWLSINP